MKGTIYQGAAERTFSQALIGLLESDYGLLGSRRVLELLSADVQQLVDQFYPVPEHLAPGWMVYTGTQASGPKAHPGQRVREHQLITLAWPVLLSEDIQELAEKGDGQAVKEAWFKKRLVRLIQYGWKHPQGPVLLTQADLCLLLGGSIGQVMRWLQEARQETGEDLLTVGYYFDQGCRPTHKAEIIAFYEAGMDEAQIARQSRHSPQGVGNYLRGYERVQLLLKHGTQLQVIPNLIDMQPKLVEEYTKLIEKYHPELLSSQSAP